MFRTTRVVTSRCNMKYPDICSSSTAVVGNVDNNLGSSVFQRQHVRHTFSNALTRCSNNQQQPTEIRHLKQPQDLYVMFRTNEMLFSHHDLILAISHQWKRNLIESLSKND
mmetsp:Transcript_20907/g.23878  ORF Transcript_20907/g.23878 Transcript_20907/m.23878 type:complete len:111 (-) Transcript_20907:133-465(-)